EFLLCDFFPGRRDVNFGDLRSQGQGDRGNKVVLTVAHGKRDRLRGEAFRYDPQLKCAGRNDGKNKLSILIGLYFLNDILRIANEFYIGPNDAVAGLVDNSASDSAIPLLVLRGG